MRFLSLIVTGIVVISPADCVVWAEKPATTPVELPTPLQRAHAHNDYYHPRPLWDALSQGFTSVEADIFLQNGELFVAHSWLEIKTARTLDNLYLQPLYKQSEANDGWIFTPGITVTLMIDIKNNGEATYRELGRQLKPYRKMLTRFEDGKVYPAAVTIVLSGDRPVDTVATQSPRWVGIDGRVSDLKTESSAYLMPMVSDSWRNHFRWRGEGEFPATEQKLLQEIVEKAQSRGHALRFWAAPDNPATWKVLKDAGVELINTDRLKEMGQFLRQN
jgi:hypothetical protein